MQVKLNHYVSKLKPLLIFIASASRTFLHIYWKHNLYFYSYLGGKTAQTY